MQVTWGEEWVSREGRGLVTRSKGGQEVIPWSAHLLQLCAGLNLPIFRGNDWVFIKPPNSKCFDSKEQLIVYLLKPSGKN